MNLNHSTFKKLFLIQFFVLPLFFLTGIATHAQTVDFTVWTFEENPLLIGNATPGPTVGSGSASIVGSMGSPGRFVGALESTGCSLESNTGGWGIQNANPGSNQSSGVQFMVSTVGYRDIVFRYDHRFSNTATRTVRIQYTLDGTSWNNFDASTNYTNNCGRGAVDNGRIDISDPVGGSAGETWSRRVINFSSISAANNNPNFGVRILAAHYQTTGQFRQADDANSIATSGAWRFDNVTFSGVEPTIFYYRGTGNLTLTSSWTTNPDGVGGIEPLNFSTPNQVFELRNATSPVTLTSSWTVSGAGSKVVVGDGTDDIEFTVDAIFNASEVDLQNKATYIIQNNTVPDFGTIDIGSTVRYTGNSSTTFDVQPVTYGTLELRGEAIKHLPDDDFTVEGDFKLEGTINTHATDFREIQFNGENLRVLEGANIQAGNGSTITTQRNTNLRLNNDVDQTISCETADDTLRIGRLISTKTSGSLTIEGNISIYNHLMLDYSSSSEFSSIGSSYMLIGGGIEADGDESNYDLNGTVEIRRLDGTTDAHFLRRYLSDDDNPAVCAFYDLILNSNADILFQPISSSEATYNIKNDLTIQDMNGEVRFGVNNIIHVEGDLINQEDSEIEINIGSALVVLGELINDGIISLIADNVEDYARLISNASSGTGTVKQQMALDPGSSFNWYAIGAPTSNISASSIGDGLFTNTSVYSWHAVNGWSPANTSSFERGEALFFAVGENSHGSFTISSTNDKIEFSGNNPDNTSDVVVNMDHGNAPTGVTFFTGLTTAEEGWNLLSNPYNADFDLNNLDTDNQSPEKAISFKIPSAYVAYSPGSNTPESRRFLPPGQGFFVRATTTGQSFTFDRSRRATSGGNGLLRTNKQIEKIEVEVRRDSLTADVTYINFLQDATTDFDGMYDAHKLLNDEDFPTFYTEIGSHRYAINSLPTLVGKYSLPAGFKTTTAGDYTISLANLPKINPTIQVYLEDKFEEIFTNLKVENYNFNHSSSNPADRFVLHFGNVALSAEDLRVKQALKCWVYDGKAYIQTSQDQGNSQIDITDLSGKIVFSTQSILPKGQTEVDIPTSLSKGVYLLKVTSDKKQKVVKFSH